MTTTNLKNITEKAFLLVAIGLLPACGPETTNNGNEGPDTLATTQAPPVNIDGFYDIPPPIQQVQLLQKAGASYDSDLLNPLDNIPKYNLTTSKALNLGVFGADLSYAAVYNKPQDVALYLSASQKLAESLGIKGDFYGNIISRMEKNSGNKDSLLQIVSDLYYKSNVALKENDQSHISALVVTGSFIEAMFISTQAAKNVKNKEAIYERIGEFKGSVSNLVGLMTTVHDTDFSNILPDLKSIKAVYDETEGSRLTDDQAKKITKLVKAIRIRITNT
jgi:hypothetical protein